MKSIRRRKLDKKPSFIYTKKIRIYPTDEQKNILKEWFDAATKMYNQTVSFIRKGIFRDNYLIPFDSANDYLNQTNFKYNLKEDRDKIMESMEHPIVGHLLDEIIMQAVSNYKTCITNLINGNIKKFRVRSWKYDRRRYILKIEPQRFSNGTFCGRTFKEMKSSEPLTNIGSTTTLQYDRDTKKYILLVPSTLEKEDRISNNQDGGVDLGVRTFATLYSNNKVVSIGNDLYKKVKKYHKKIDKINELLQIPSGQRETFVQRKTVNKRLSDDLKEIITEISEDMVPKKIKRTSLKRALRKYHRKIKNMVRDLHFKAAHFLVTNFDSIYIGKLSTKKILSKNNTKITKRTKRMVGVLSPYLFRQRLKYMGNKYGIDVSEENEYMTTVTCPNCGRINYIGRKKEHKCRCGMETDRDVASGKNLLKVGYERDTTRNYDLELCQVHNEDIHVVYNKRLNKYEVIEI